MIRRILAAVVLLAAGAGWAVNTVVNSGTAHVTDDAGGAQPPVTATVSVDLKTNPVIRIFKSVTPASAARGMPVEYSLTVLYTQTGTACGDDSLARNVFVYDTIPPGLTFVPMSASLSGDGGLSYTALTATNYDAARRTVTVPLGVLGECTGGMAPSCGSGGCARVVKFRVTVD